MEEVIEVFKKLNIEYSIMRHPAIFNRKDEEKLDGIKFEGECCKNLFLKDKKDNTFYLVSLPVTKKADLKKISEQIESHRLSFGNADELQEKLNIKPGSVSILNVICSPDTDVIFIIDKELLNVEKVTFHPNDNTASITFTPENIVKIMNNYNKKYMFIDVEA